MNILYEDNHLLVAVKPQNIPSQRDASEDEDMLSLMKGYIKEKYQKPGSVYLGLVHRLDRPAGGVMVFARTSKAAARLSGQMQNGEFKKRYFAILRGEAPPSGELMGYLVKDEKNNLVRSVPKDVPGAKFARLTFQTVKTSGGLSLVDILLDTGRPHQIRVQFSDFGHPLWGDNRYGGAKPGQQLALFAHSLAFKHPTTGERMTFTARPPDAPAWNTFFQTCSYYSSEVSQNES